MKKAKGNRAPKYPISNNPYAIFVIAVLAVIMGVFFIFSQNDNKPVSREEAVAYSGTFDHYDDSLDNYREIYFEDGSFYYVYPHTETYEFNEMMHSLEKGTKLYLLVNPNNEYVAEIKTDTEELLDFEESQKAIDDYDNGYIGIGIFIICCAAFLTFYAVGSLNFEKKEKKRNNARKAGIKSVPLRREDGGVKHRVLLEADVDGYKICYRRVKTVNELAVNGQVYDEMKAFIEFAHKLVAFVDEHEIEAGYDEDSYSYIKFDGKIVKEKKRYV